MLKIPQYLFRAIFDHRGQWYEEIENEGVRDFVQGVSKWRIWNHMAMSDIRRRYKRTRIGPFWTSFNLLVFVFSTGILYAYLWKMNISDYLPYLTSGLITWWVIATTITDSSTAFIGNLGILRQTRLPFSVFIYGVVWQNVILMGHHLMVYVLMVALLRVPVNWNTLLLLPGLVLVCLNGVWLGMFLAIVCSRFRDLQAGLPLFMQIMTLVTPIFWPIENLPPIVRHIFLTPNILYHFCNIVRSPLLGKAPSMLSWGMTIGVTIIGWTFIVYFARRFLHRITYWL